MNQKLGLRNASGYKGVHWYPPTSKWQAQIKISGKRQHLGYFTTPEAAAEVYDAVAVQYFGEFACTNVSLGIIKPRKECLGLTYVF